MKTAQQIADETLRDCYDEGYAWAKAKRPLEHGPYALGTPMDDHFQRGFDAYHTDAADKAGSLKYGY